MAVEIVAGRDTSIWMKRGIAVRGFGKSQPLVNGGGV